MKISQLFIALFLFTIVTTGCEKQNLGSIAAFRVFVPNVIAIDSEEHNIFYVQVITDNPGVELTVELLEIFDRYGNPMFKTEQVPPNDSSFGWDGRLEGELVESGTYSYSFRVGDGEGSILYVGDFTVLL